MEDKTLAPIRYVRRIHQKADREMASLQNCCSRGCAHCCYQLVEVLHLEELPIIDFISHQMGGEEKQQVMKNLHAWLRFFEEKTPVNDLLSYNEVFAQFKNLQAEECFPCPFLVNNECIIYEVRPLACRLHIAADYPELCIHRRLRNTTPEAEQIWSHILAILAQHFPLYVLPLPYIAAQVLFPERELKGIRFEVMLDLTQ